LFSTLKAGKRGVPF